MAQAAPISMNALLTLMDVIKTQAAQTPKVVLAAHVKTVLVEMAQAAPISMSAPLALITVIQTQTAQTMLEALAAPVSPDTKETVQAALLLNLL